MNTKRSLREKDRDRLHKIITSPLYNLKRI